MKTLKNGPVGISCLLSVVTAFGIISATQQVRAAACASVPSGLVGWWPAEGNANDIQGTNNGVFTGSVYSAGEVGQAFNFDGSGNNVRVAASPSLDVGAGAGMTIESWIYSADNSSTRPIVEWVPSEPGTFGAHFYINQNGTGTLYANLFDTQGNSHIIETEPGLIQLNVYQHIAVTYDKSTGIARLFVNGSMAKESTLGTFTPVTSPDLCFGLRPNTVPFGPIIFAGRIDEVSLYSRALTSEEVQTIYSAGSLGKCTSPTPPSIFSQPTNQTAWAGSTVNLVVGAGGTQPLAYQWTMDATNLTGATNAVLTLTNVLVSQSGTYAVVISNSLGSLVSSNAVLTVNPAPPCVPAPTNLIGWWQAEGNAADLVGTDNGANMPGVAFGPGIVGEAFTFDGVNGGITIPASPTLAVDNITIEAWISPTDLSHPRPIFEYGNSTGLSTLNFWYNLGSGAQPSSGALFAAARDATNQNNSFYVASSPGVLPANQWSHVAFTYDSQTGKAVLYLNGASVATVTVAIPVHPDTHVAANIGYRPFGSWDLYAGASHAGKLDEVSLYGRALSAGEIGAIYSAALSGKCIPQLSPTIAGQPSDESLLIGSTAVFTVAAVGSQPLSYQWSFNNQAIEGATDASLVLTNVQRSQAGAYSVVVTNAYGTAASSNATLVVNFPPATVKVVTTTGAAGQTVTVPVVLVANGNENALGFSLNFNPTLLTNIGVTLGSGATGGSLQFNANQAGSVGIGVTLPAGATLAPGTQEVAEVTFISAVSPSPYTVPVSFGDQPVNRELSDVNAHLLPANFSSGQVKLSRSSFEADVAPRPGGDGAVTIVDWVQVGRYVAGLDSPTNASEFQRADCAPRTTAGDGALTVSDWVQAGRYAAKLDPAVLAGGPNTPSGGTVRGPARKQGSDPLRAVTIQGPLMFQGQTATASVELAAQGDENGVGFSLTFDPAVVHYTGALLGIDATSAAMNVNVNQATNGQLGVVLALPTNTSFTPGNRELVKLSFQAVTTNSVDSAVALTDLPVKREVSDTNALPVVTTFSDSVISVNPKPSLGISQANQTITLSWPLWATNYTLEQAAGNTLPINLWTNLSIMPTSGTNGFHVNVPVGGAVQFYRLQHQ